MVLGGQAIIEGVMFRSADRVVASVRKPDGKIKVKDLKLNLFSNRFKKWFFVRGIFNLIEAVYIGVKAINYSAAESLEEEEGKESKVIFVFTLLASIALALFIFKFLPYLFASVMPVKSNILFNLIEGAVKFMIFVLYIYLISKIKDIKVLFQYHGVEHKTINCYEAGKELNIKNVKKYSTFHKRCGTSFLLLVVVVSILFYILIPFSFGFYFKFLLRILLLPFIAGFAYEFLKFSAKYDFFTFPGRFMQKMTTKEPNDKQIEVAIAGLKRLVEK